jgi:hypothetical protein
MHDGVLSRYQDLGMSEPLGPPIAAWTEDEAAKRPGKDLME